MYIITCGPIHKLRQATKTNLLSESLSQCSHCLCKYNCCGVLSECDSDWRDMQTVSSLCVTLTEVLLFTVSAAPKTLSLWLWADTSKNRCSSVVSSTTKQLITAVLLMFDTAFKSTPCFANFMFTYSVRCHHWLNLLINPRPSLIGQSKTFWDWGNLVG